MASGQGIIRLRAPYFGNALVLVCDPTPKPLNLVFLLLQIFCKFRHEKYDSPIQGSLMGKMTRIRQILKNVFFQIATF